MSQYLITTQDQQKAEALIQFLRSLDFIKVEAVVMEDRLKAAAETREFLKSLPERPYRQSDVNKAVKSIRKSEGYN